MKNSGLWIKITHQNKEQLQRLFTWNIFLKNNHCYHLIFHRVILWASKTVRNRLLVWWIFLQIKQLNNYRKNYFKIQRRSRNILFQLMVLSTLRVYKNYFLLLSGLETMLIQDIIIPKLKVLKILDFLYSHLAES